MAQPALTAKQRRFVDEYLLDLNATQAAVRAGYSAKTANQQGPRLLVNVGIAAAIAKRQAKVAEAADLTLQSHLDTLNGLRDQAASVEQYSAAVSAEVSRGKAAGFYVEKRELQFKGPLQVQVQVVREGRRVTAS